MFENLDVANLQLPTDPRFGAGPSLVPLKHLEALKETAHTLLGTSHRKAAVKNLVASTQKELLCYFSAPSDYKVVMGNGGATLLFDMIGLGLVNKKSIHYTCGEFSEKWFKSHDQIPWIEAENVAAQYGDSVDISKGTKGADVVCTTLNETSTGVQNTELPAVDDQTLLCVDATSGAGQIACDLNKVDVFFFSPQKVFAAEGGLWVAIMSPKAIRRALQVNELKDRYIPGIMNWKNAIDNGEKGQTYNTPSISTIFLLHEQVKAMNELGAKNVYSLAKEKADLVYSWANEKKYLSCFVKKESARSLAVATIDIDDRIPAGDLCAVLRSQNIAWDIDSYRKLGRNQLRIGIFHNVTKENLQRLLNIISKAIEDNL